MPDKKRSQTLKYQFFLFTQMRDWRVRAIQQNEDWLPAWLKDNPPPPDSEGEI
jgi:hypothetical protein